MLTLADKAAIGTVWHGHWHASVGYLLFSVSPSHVARFVISVVVNAINGESRVGSFAHISEKISKVIPAFADLNAARTVVSVCLAAWVVASLPHATPDVVKNRAFIFIFAGVAVLVSGAFVFFTATRSDDIMSKAGCWQFARLATVALAQPYVTSGVIFVAGPAKRDQSSETLIGDIFWEAHGTAPIGSREVAGLVPEALIPLRIIA
jgi:hypothetical protein